MKRTFFYLILLATTLTIGCEKDTNLVNDEISSTSKLIQSFSTNLDIGQLKGSTLSEKEIVLLMDKGRELEVEEVALGTGRHAICGGLVHYPNGNESPPCLVRHKITYLPSLYERYEDEIEIFLRFEFVTPSCTAMVSSVPGLYEFECVISSDEVLNLYMYYYRYDSVEDSYHLVRRRICTKLYTCG